MQKNRPVRDTDGSATYAVGFLFVFLFGYNLNLDGLLHLFVEFNYSCVNTYCLDSILEVDDLAVDLMTELCKSLGNLSGTHGTEDCA